MTQADKLREVMQRAIDNGWDMNGYLNFVVLLAGTKDKPTVQIMGEYQSSHKPVVKTTDVSIETIIFSHDFAKAFWGEEIYETDLLEYDDTPEDDRWGRDYDGRHYYSLPVWQYHLQQLVLQDNYIDYLYSFIGGDK